jgi:epoxyqueuosine reductase
VQPSATRRGYPAEEDGADPVRDALILIGRNAGLAAVGVTHAGVFEETRRHLLERRRTGLSADMQFTYRNPERSTDPGRILPGARSLVVGAWSYRRHEPDETVEPHNTVEPQDTVDGRPRSGPVGLVARYARRDHYASLRHGLDAMAGHLGSLGWRAVVVCDDNALTDRAAAHRAGLGWFGKNSLILVPGSGSWVVLGAVVTNAALAPSAPEGPTDHAAGCGSCSRCLTACPTGALVAPGVLDARRCLAWLVQATGSFPEQYRRALGGRIYGCDECQQVCPINRVAERRSPGSAPEADTEPQVNLVALLGATDAELMAAHGRWYIPDRDPRYLRRNALVALGNVGDGGDPATLEVLRRWMSGDDPMLAEHARWAAGELGRSDLMDGGG